MNEKKKVDEEPVVESMWRFPLEAAISYTGELTGDGAVITSIHFPAKSLGAFDSESFLDGRLRDLATYASYNPEGEEAGKYGTNFENDVFMMHQFCGCQQDDCKWCEHNEPNFHHKATGLKIWWYKHIGRVPRMQSGNLSRQEIAHIFGQCEASVKKESEEIARDIKYINVEKMRLEFDIYSGSYQLEVIDRDGVKYHVPFCKSVISFLVSEWDSIESQVEERLLP